MLPEESNGRNDAKARSHRPEEYVLRVYPSSLRLIQPRSHRKVGKCQTQQNRIAESFVHCWKAMSYWSLRFRLRDTVAHAWPDQMRFPTAKGGKSMNRVPSSKAVSVPLPRYSECFWLPLVRVARAQSGVTIGPLPSPLLQSSNGSSRKS